MELNTIAKEYTDLQSRKIHPPGQFDKAGRWFPNEEFNCCINIRNPSRNWPYSLLKHCRTTKHLSHKYNISEKDLKREIKKVSPNRRPKKACENGIAFKKMAISPSGRLCSIYDGSEYILRQTKHQRTLQNHNGGFYIYEDIIDAIRAPFPENSICKHLPQIIVKCQVWGSYCRYGSKLAFSNIKPINIEKIL